MLATIARQLRRASGITQEELGLIMGVKTRTVQYWEAGNAPSEPATKLMTEMLRQTRAMKRRK